MKLFIGAESLYPGYVQDIRDRVPDIQVTDDFSEVLTLAHAGVLERVCVIMCCLWDAQINIEGWEIGYRLHSIDEKLPILIWDGERTWETHEHLENEVLLSSFNYSMEERVAIIEKFYKGTLKAEDCTHGIKAVGAAGTVFVQC